MADEKPYASIFLAAERSKPRGSDRDGLRVLSNATKQAKIVNEKPLLIYLIMGKSGP